MRNTKLIKRLSLLQIVAFSLVIFINFVGSDKIFGKEILTIKSDTKSVQMGRTFRLKAHLKLKSESLAKNYLLLPYVNNRRWGAQEKPDSNGDAIFIIPLPKPGCANIQVIAVKSENDNWMGISNRDLLMVGKLMPENVGISSNKIKIIVKRRKMPKLPDDSHFFCIQYETWFSPESSYWQTAEAVPLIGFYDSYNEDVIRQQILWLVDIGVNTIMLDWSNHIWGDEHWNQRGNGARTIINNTTFFLEVLAKMRDDGIDIPKVVLMTGLSNGPPATVEALNEELHWIYQNYILNPRFKNLFWIYEDKPLMVILDTGVIGNKKGTSESAFRVPFLKQTLALSVKKLNEFRAAQVPIDDTHFTIRYMSTQNQITHHNKLGYWSWMDGQLEPIVTYYKGNPEAITVTPSFFVPGGWTAQGSYGRLGGTTYLATFKVALKYRPRVIFLHQFNEFAGQRKGHGYGKNKSIFLDEYSKELSDDIEPVSLTTRGYREDKGGWGFYYLNLTHALIDIFRGNSRGSTILAVAPPHVVKDKLYLNWSTAGVLPRNFTIAIDGKTVIKNITGTSCNIPIDGLTSGYHNITVVANGAITHYPLSKIKFDNFTRLPMLVKVKRVFHLNRNKR